MRIRPRLRIVQAQDQASRTSIFRKPEKPTRAHPLPRWYRDTQVFEDELLGACNRTTGPETRSGRASMGVRWCAGRVDDLMRSDNGVHPVRDVAQVFEELQEAAAQVCAPR